MTADNLLIVSGPTASGKSSLSLRLAGDLQAEILNADSVQVYKDFDIGSAKLSERERAAIPHHLIDLFEPSQSCNVARYLIEAEKILSQLKTRGKPALLCGGSTLYISALLSGLDRLPAANPELRAELETFSNQELWQRLSAVDNKSAEQLHQNDRVRLMRAIEICEISGEKISRNLEREQILSTSYKAICLVLCWERAQLYSRIDLRVEQMLQSGLIDEVRAIIARYTDTAQALRSLGYAQVVKYLRSEFDLKTLNAEIAMQTRRFAKRQSTFWRNEPKKRGWLLRPGPQEKSRLLINKSLQTAKQIVQPTSVISVDYSTLKMQLIEALKQPLSNNEVWFVDAVALSV